MITLIHVLLKLLHPSPFLPSSLHSILDRLIDRPTDRSGERTTPHSSFSHVHLHCGRFLLSRSHTQSPALHGMAVQLRPRCNTEKSQETAAATQIYATTTTTVIVGWLVVSRSDGAYVSSFPKIMYGRHFISKVTRSCSGQNRVCPPPRVTCVLSSVLYIIRGRSELHFTMKDELPHRLRGRHKPSEDETEHTSASALPSASQSQWLDLFICNTGKVKGKVWIATEPAICHNSILFACPLRARARRLSGI